MTNNKQQTINVIIRDNECEEIRLTPVEIIEDYLKFIGFINLDKTVPQVIKGVINQAKRMEKEQIINAWKAGDGKYDKVADKLAEQYYNETYGGGEK